MFIDFVFTNKMRSLILFSLLITLTGHRCLSIDEDSICAKDAAFIFTESSGDIYSPGYLSNQSYPEGITCKWSILIPDGQNLRIKFEDLDLDESMDCSYDSVAFFVQSFGMEVLFKRVCGTWKPDDLLISSFSTLIVEFTSDYVFSGRGFHISWTVEESVNQSSKQEFKCSSGESVPITSRCNNQYECLDGSDEINCSDQKLPEYECGQQKIKPDLSGFTDRILGGDVVIPGSWPWQVDLQFRTIWPSGHYCGGALIHPQYILTAGHCAAAVPFPEDVRVVLGNFNSFKNDGFEQIRVVESVKTFKTKELDPGTMFDQINDIAIIKLKVPINVTDSVNPVCLADFKAQLKPGSKCYVTGWGSTRGTGANGILKQIIVELIDIKSCLSGMPDDVFLDTTNDSQICIKTGGHGSGVCSGDSGGPLVCQLDDGRWYLYGITSMVTSSTILGPICGDRDGTAVYTNVSTKISWINEMMTK